MLTHQDRLLFECCQTGNFCQFTSVASGLNPLLSLSSSVPIADGVTQERKGSVTPHWPNMIRKEGSSSCDLPIGHGLSTVTLRYCAINASHILLPCVGETVGAFERFSIVRCFKKPSSSAVLNSASIVRCFKKPSSSAVRNSALRIICEERRCTRNTATRAKKKGGGTPKHQRRVSILLFRRRRFSSKCKGKTLTDLLRKRRE